jgi:hypothetical protein
VYDAPKHCTDVGQTVVRKTKHLHAICRGKITMKFIFEYFARYTYEVYTIQILVGT